MRRDGIFRSRVWPWILVVCLLITAASLASVLTRSELYCAEARGSIAARLLGRSVSALAAYSLDRADTAFHGGRPHSRENAFDDHYFQIVRREIAPAEHVHLQAGEVGEIMPWLRFATWLDPYNVEYYLIASYWLGQIGDAKKAVQVLLDAQWRNPRSYLVHMGKGRCYVKADDRVKAKRAYDKAILLWPGDQDPKDKQTQLDWREILSARTVLYELDGDTNHAIGLMREIVAMFPHASAHFEERIAALEAGEDLRGSALDRWKILQKKAYHSLCEEDAEGHGQHEDDE